MAVFINGKIVFKGTAEQCKAYELPVDCCNWLYCEFTSFGWIPVTL